MIVVAIVPFLSMVIYLFISLVNYNRVYEEIINNVTIANLRSDSMELMQYTTDRESLAWLQSLQRNLDTLQARMNDLKENIDEGGRMLQGLRRKSPRVTLRFVHFRWELRRSIRFPLR